MADRATNGSMRGRGPGNWPIFGLALASLIGGSSLATAAAAGPALPTGGVVQAGSATIGASGGSSLTVNQTSSRAIIDWAGFSIGSGGAVQFNNGSGATLNRVTGFSASTIDGLLSGTGSVYLINPNGVIVGKSGKVDVGGTFAASTLDVSNAAFMAGGDLTFSGTSNAAVINYGKIGSLGGDVALIAAKVENDGEIDAANGDVGLAAGYKVLLRDAALNDGKFAVLVGGLNTSATNTGVIQAAEAELRANGGNVYALAGNTTSIIKATGVSSSDGKVFLIADGGATVAHGEIDATKADGTGGSVETSGTTVDFTGLTVKAGNWLIDPYDLTIDSTAASTIQAALNASTSVTLQTTASSAPETGVTGAGIVNPSGNGDITIMSAIHWTSTGTTLTLDAYHSVAIDAAITVDGGTSGLIVKTNDGGSGGVLSFGSSGAANFNSGLTNQVLNINSQAYTLEYSMANLITAITGNASGSYALGAGFAAGSTATAPIASFAGNLEGLGHTVTGLTITTVGATSDVGMIGSLTGTVADLNLTGVAITDTGGSDVGGLAGASSGTIRNVSVTGSVAGASDVGGIVGSAVGGSPYGIYTSSSSASVSGSTDVGGVVGLANASLVGDWSGGTVTGGVSATGIGGLVGESDYQISLSYSSAAVVGGHNTSSIGGLVGLNKGSIVQSAAIGSVSTGYSSTAIGGFVGTNNGTIANSYATSSVAASADNTGTGDAPSSDIGGFVGVQASSGGIQYSFAATPSLSVTNDTSAGAFAGSVSGSNVITNSVYDKTLQGGASYGSGTFQAGLAAVSTADMQNPALIGSVYAGWDFTTIWATPGGGFYPRLYGVSHVLKVTAGAGHSTYGNTPSATTQPFSVLGLQGNDTLGALTGIGFTTPAGDHSDVGTYALTPTGSVIGAPSGSYNVAADVAGTLTIDPRPLTLTLTGLAKKTYDGTNLAVLFGSNFSTDAVNGDTFTILSSATYGGVDVGTTLVTATGLSISGAKAMDYVLTSTGPISGNIGEIDPLSITATLNGVISKTYDNTTSASLGSNYALNGVLPGDVGYLGLTALPANGSYDTKDVGTGKQVTFTSVTLGAGGSGNRSVDYVLTSTTVTGLVGKITPLTITPSLTGTIITKTYDGTTSATLTSADYSLPTLGSDVVTLTGTGAYIDKIVGTGKKVTFSGLTLGGTDGADYALSTTSLSELTGTILQKELTLALTGLVQKTYDGTADAALTSSNYLLTGVVTGDAVTFTGPTGPASGQYNDATAGSGKLVTVNFLPSALSGGDSGNYTLALYGGVLTGNVGVISAAGLTVTLVGPATKTYDGNNTVTDMGDITYTLTGASGDVHVNATGASGTYNNANAGTNKTVTVTGLTLAGTDALNYTINSTASGAIGVINPKSITASLTGTTIQKQYDGTTKATLTLADYQFAPGDIITGDQVGLGVTSGNYDTKDVTGSPTKLVTFKVFLNGPQGANYTLTNPGSIISGAYGKITPKPITNINLIGIIEKTYDGNTSATLGNNYSFVGVYTSDLPTLTLTGTGNYDTPHVGTNKPVTFTNLVLGGASAVDYIISPSNLSISGNVGKIDPKALTASVTGTIEKTYDGATTASLGSNYSLSGVVFGDTVTLTAASGAYDTKNAGSNKMVRFNGLALAGGNPGDYKLSSTTMIGLTNGQIDPKSVSLTLVGTVEKTYDGTTTATLKASNYSTSDLIPADGVTVVATSGTYTAGKHVGSGLNVSFTGIHLTGANASNYLLNTTSLSGAVGKIDPKAITISLVGTVTKLYDGNANAFIQPANYSVVGFIPGDTVALNKPTHGTYNNAAKGTGKTVTVTGLALTGASAGDYTFSTTVSAPIGVIK